MNNKYHSLKEYLATHAHQGYNGLPHYYEDGDFLTYFTKEDRCFGEQVDPYLTVYRSVEDRSIVGVKVKRVSQAMISTPSGAASCEVRAEMPSPASESNSTSQSSGG